MSGDGADAHRARPLRRRLEYARIPRLFLIVQSNLGSLVAVLVLSVLTGIALFAARNTDQYFGNLMLNVGASFLGAVVTFALVNPLMTRAERAAAEAAVEKILDHFDYAGMIQRVQDSENIVRIFDTGLTLLGEDYRERFLGAVQELVERVRSPAEA